MRPAAVKAGVIKEGEKVRFGFHNFRHALATALVKLKVDAYDVCHRNANGQLRSIRNHVAMQSDWYSNLRPLP
ncbi:MAG: hypothetical protein WA261_00080 [Candidatus Sulfotelmatobacter sp.]